MDKNKIIVLQGPPACGKSTWAKEFIKDKTNWIIANRDGLRNIGNTLKFNDREKIVKDLEVYLIEQALSNHMNVVVDDTNLKQSTIDKWKEIAEKFECEIEFKEFYVPYKEACERAHKREINGGIHISDRDIKRFYQTYYKDRLNEEQKQTISHYRLEQDKELPPVIICDIDGTVSWMQERSPYDYSKVINDKPDEQLCHILNGYMKNGGRIIFLSGREGTEQCEEDTLQWLKTYLEYSDNFQLFMRKKGDFRPDEIVKREIFENEIKDKYNVLCVVDDRNKVVNMWREIGLLCFQINDGNF